MKNSISYAATTTGATGSASSANPLQRRTDVKGNQSCPGYHPGYDKDAGREL